MNDEFKGFDPSKPIIGIEYVPPRQKLTRHQAIVLRAESAARSISFQHAILLFRTGQLSV